MDDIDIVELDLDDEIVDEPDVKCEPEYFIEINEDEDEFEMEVGVGVDEDEDEDEFTASFRYGVSTRASYQEQFKIRDRRDTKGRGKVGRPKENRSTKKSGKTRGRPKGSTAELKRAKKARQKKDFSVTRRDAATGVYRSPYTPESLPIEIRQALREKIRLAVQELAATVHLKAGTTGEKAVRLQAQGYRVAGRILVRQNAKDGRNKFTVCGKLAEAAGLTEVNNLCIYL